MENTPILAKRGDPSEIENSALFMPKFDAHGLIPAIASDAETGAVLMFAFMNEEALKKTIETGEAHYWSRSRKELWHKGATSGHIQTVHEICTDCDQDVILLEVRQTGNACHVGYRSCFYRRIEGVEADGTMRLSISKEAGSS